MVKYFNCDDIDVLKCELKLRLTLFYPENETISSQL